MSLKSIVFIIAAGLLILLVIKGVKNKIMDYWYRDTIVNTTIDMKAGNFEDFLISKKIKPDKITKLILVGDPYSNTLGITKTIDDTQKIVQTWNKYFKNAKPFNRYYGQGSRRLDIYIKRYPQKPVMILLVDPTDLTMPHNYGNRGFKCPGLEKWIRAELGK